MGIFGGSNHEPMPPRPQTMTPFDYALLQQMQRSGGMGFGDAMNYAALRRALETSRIGRGESRQERMLDWTTRGQPAHALKRDELRDKRALERQEAANEAAMDRQTYATESSHQLYDKQSLDKEIAAEEERRHKTGLVDKEIAFRQTEAEAARSAQLTIEKARNDTALEVAKIRQRGGPGGAEDAEKRARDLASAALLKAQAAHLQPGMTPLTPEQKKMILSTTYQAAMEVFGGSAGVGPPNPLPTSRAAPGSRLDALREVHTRIMADPTLAKEEAVKAYFQSVDPILVDPSVNTPEKLADAYSMQTFNLEQGFIQGEAALNPEAYAGTGPGLDAMLGQSGAGALLPRGTLSYFDAYAQNPDDPAVPVPLKELYQEYPSIFAGSAENAYTNLVKAMSGGAGPEHGTPGMYGDQIYSASQRWKPIRELFMDLKVTAARLGGTNVDWFREKTGRGVGADEIEAANRRVGLTGHGTPGLPENFMGNLLDKRAMSAHEKLGALR